MHVVSAVFPEPVLLMEVMPVMLSRRAFPPPATLRRLEPGFRDAPDPTTGLALLFVQVLDADKNLLSQFPASGN